MDQEPVAQPFEVVKDPELGINVAKPKDANQTNDLELANHELCDAYMHYKELANQCVIDFGSLQATEGVDLTEDYAKDSSEHTSQKRSQP